MLNQHDREHAVRFTVEIDTKGAAFHGSEPEPFNDPPGVIEGELARLLRKTADRIEAGEWLRTADNNVLIQHLLDINGNTCGRVTFVRNIPEEE